MIIEVISATGEGKTQLSAFDSALNNAGVYNYNLIALSSIIPIGAIVAKKKKYVSNPEHFGHRLYVVKADIRSRQSEKVIAAGVGWYMLQNGGGVFVEHEIEGLTKHSVEEEIDYTIARSIEDLVSARGESFNPTQMNKSIAICEISRQARCALTLAVYKSEPW
jgi:arginine decarboxylase